MDSFQSETLDELESLLGEQLTTLLELFQDESSRLYASMLEALAADDRAQLRHHAHSLKGASSNLGAIEIQRCCERIENGAESAATADLAVLCDQLSMCHEKALGELKQHLGAA